MLKYATEIFRGFSEPLNEALNKTSNEAPRKTLNEASAYESGSHD